MNPLWRIELLEGLAAVREEQRLTRFTTQQVAALLAYLAFYRERAHQRDELVELLWPESEPAAGRPRLRVALNSLRHQLEPPGIAPGAVLLATRPSVQLNPAACTTDVAAFEAACRRAARAGPGPEQVRQLAAAVELYRGELLPGSLQEWILPERQRLAELYLQALSRLVCRLEQQGDRSAALEYARRAVAADPLREEARHDLIRLLAAAGEPEAARREYEELAERLVAAGGVQPAPEIHALVSRLAPPAVVLHAAAPTEAPPRAGRLHNGPEPAPGRPDGSPCREEDALPGEPGNLPAVFTRFFGREAEIARLQEILLSRLRE